MKLVNITETESFSQHDDGTIELRCPYCQMLLLEQLPEEEGSLNTCSHVLFRWDSTEAIEFFGDWNRVAFEKNFLELLANADDILQYRTDHEGDEPRLVDYFLSSDTITNTLEQFQDDSIGKVLCLTYQQESWFGGIGAAAIMWGMR